MSSLQDSLMVDVADQQGIVETYCVLEDFGEEEGKKLMEYAKLCGAERNVDILSNPICENLLPEDYQNDIMEETVFQVISEKIRIFRDLDPYIQLSLAYQFKVSERARERERERERENISLSIVKYCCVLLASLDRIED